MRDTEKQGTFYAFLRAQLRDIAAKDLPEPGSPEVSALFERYDEISKATQKHKFEMSAPEALEIYLETEGKILELLKKYAQDALPPAEAVRIATQVAGSQRAKVLSEIQSKYQYAFRYTNDPHLYLLLLRKLEDVYGKIDPTADELWFHELGHFSRYLAQPNAIEYGPDTKKLTHCTVIILREGTELRYQAVMNQDMKNLTDNEKLDVAYEEDEPSIGDLNAVAHLQNKIRSGRK